MRSELLKGLRMLDLSDEKGALCGKMFADMGAEVIKVEPPPGCPSRRIPPYLDDQPDLEHSLHFLAFQAGKRSITLNLECADGRELLKQLVKRSDFLVESFAVGHLDSMGLGYEALAKINPRLIYTSITPFGDKGPGKDYQWADILTWAAGGAMFLMGEEGKPPLQMSLPQAGLHAGAEAAVSSLIAHYPRQVDGLGQHITVDMQACIVWTLMNEQAMPILHGNHLSRTGMFSGSADARRQMVYPCADGHISILIAGGVLGGSSTKALIGWMSEKGAASDWMRSKDWVAWVPGVLMQMTQKDRDEIAELEDPVRRFFMTMTKRDIYHEGLKRRILLAPVANAADIASDEQLKAREYFVPVPYETLGRTLTLPGAFAKMSATPIGSFTRAPRIGEHNDEIYRGLLAISRQRLAGLRESGAI